MITQCSLSTAGWPSAACLAAAASWAKQIHLYPLHECQPSLSGRRRSAPLRELLACGSATWRAWSDDLQRVRSRHSHRTVRACAEEEDEGEEDKPKTKTVKETVWDWELLNDNKALWLRTPGDVSEEEYTKFFQALAKARPAAVLGHGKCCAMRICH